MLHILGQFAAVQYIPVESNVVAVHWCAVKCCVVLSSISGPVRCQWLLPNYGQIFSLSPVTTPVSLVDTHNGGHCLLLDIYTGGHMDITLFALVISYDGGNCHLLNTYRGGLMETVRLPWCPVIMVDNV